jgi:hypothetical protein
MTRQELEERAADMLGQESLAEMKTRDLQELMTVTQYITDMCLSLIEDRGDLEFDEGIPIVPYMSDFAVETILTRDDDDA